MYSAIESNCNIYNKTLETIIVVRPISRDDLQFISLPQTQIEHYFPPFSGMLSEREIQKNL